MLDEVSNNLFLLNETSYFLIENCENKTILELIHSFLNQLNEKESLNFQEVQQDCIKVIEDFISYNIICFE